MSKKTKEERLVVVLEIANKLRYFQGPDGTIDNLYNDEYQAIKELKEIFKNYVQQDEKNLVSFSGSIKFPEIGRKMEYILPTGSLAKSLFVLKRL